MLTQKSRVGEILDKHPTTEQVFAELGFTELLNPVMRASVAKFATLEVAAAKKKMDVDALIARLEKHIQEAES